MQFLDQVKARVYAEYRQKVYDLNSFLEANPLEANIQPFQQLMQISYYVLNNLNLDDLPISAEGFNKISHPLLIGHKKLQRKAKRELLNPEEFLSFQYTSNVLPILRDIEDGLCKLRVIFTAYQLFIYESKMVVKFLIVLLFSLIGFVAFRGNVLVQPNFIFPIVFSILILTTLIFVEFYGFLKYMLKNFIESWRWA